MHQSFFAMVFGIGSHFWAQSQEDSRVSLDAIGYKYKRRTSKVMVGTWYAMLDGYVEVAMTLKINRLRTKTSSFIFHLRL